MRNRAIRLAGAICAGLLMAGPVNSALTQEAQGIAAVVNDEVVSAYDLEQRVALIVSSTGVDGTGEAGKRLREQVLRTLIDERLQMQEAKRLEIEADPKDVEETLSGIAEQNNMTTDQLRETLEKSGVSMDSLTAQIKAEIAWSDLVRKKFLSRVSPGDEQVDEVLARMQANAGRTEFLVAEIFLGVESPDDEEEVNRGALRLVEQLQQGAPFNAVARQFSQASTAGSGGDLGWVPEGQLSAELDKSLASLSPGDVSEPLRAGGGYYILLLRDKRSASAVGLSGIEVDVRQVMFPYVDETQPDKRITVPNPTPAHPMAAAAIARSQNALQPGVTCESFLQTIKDLGKSVLGDGGKMMLADVPHLFRETTEKIDIGVLSPPLLSPQGVHRVMVCSREEFKSKLPPRDVVEARLNQEALALRARRYLRDLRRDAVVEFR
ncbi:MAG: peptidyl-prolyl cis-trans isomerase SurA [Alphaproteobacteria bacterium]|nr:peptidyl-prolyl cis-trans isomerase SurA [Alphaproteobacteria bacterium]